MLSDEEKQRIVEQEQLRRELRAELDPPNEKPLLAGDNVKWLATTILIPLVAFGTSYCVQHNAERSIEGRQDVTQLTALLPTLASNDQTQRCISLAVLRELGSINKDTSALKATYETISGQSWADRGNDNPNTKAKGAKAAACLAPPGREQSGGIQLAPPSTVPAGVPSAPPRKDELVYMQIYRSDQSQEAQTLTSALEAAGIPVATLDDIGADHGPGVIPYAQTGTIDIRYYYEDDLPLAVALARIVQQTTRQTPTLRDLSGRPNKARKGVLEIWYPCAPAGAQCVIG